MYLANIIYAEETDEQEKPLSAKDDVLKYAFMVFMVVKTLAFDLSF